jgi:pimeloyl-ACP methyl ester carboxylesterase
MHWMFYEPNLQNEKTQRLFDCVLNQMSLGAKYFRMGTVVPPLPYKDEELRSVRNPTLLLIGQQEALYHPIAAVDRAKQLIPDIQAELIPQASHDMPISQHGTVNQKILEFLKES